MKYKRFFILMLISVLLASTISLMVPMLIQYWNMENIVLTERRIVYLIIIFVIQIIIEMVITYGREVYARNFNIMNCRGLLNKFLGLKYDTINEKGSHYLIDRIAISVNNLYNYYTGGVIGIWSNTIVIVTIFLIVLTQSPLQAFILITAAPLNYIGYKLINKKLLAYSRLLQEKTSTNWQHILSIYQHTDFIKQNAQNENLLKRVEPSLNEIYTTMAKVNTFAQTSSQVISSMNTMANTLIIVLLVYNFVRGVSSPLTLVLYAIMLPLYFSNLSAIVSANLSKQELLSSKEFINTLDYEQEETSIKKIDKIDSISLKIKELRIANKVLSENIYGEYKHGDIVWITGESGIGKSTLVKTILKFRKNEGIYINNIDLQDIEIHSLRTCIEYLSQDVPIIEGSLRDNLFLGKDYSEDKELLLKNDTILRTVLATKTMDTQIQVNGANLSGGEKQKIAVARSISNNSDVMILDEITTNIDNEAATEIYSRIKSICKEKIVFIISHDPLPEEFYNKVLRIPSNINRG